jgi:four helix bundle protein
MKSYKDLLIYQLSYQISLKIRLESVKLSQSDQYEVGAQIRRSSQSIKDNIVEGYGRRVYKADFIKHLIYAQASLLEARSQAEFIYDINKNPTWHNILLDLDKLGVKLNNFISYVKNHWR